MTDHAVSDVDLSDATQFDDGIPHARFAAMREASGLTGNKTDEPDGGFWSVGRYMDVCAVSRDTETFSSAAGHIQIYNIDEDALAARASMIDMDPPDHTRLRKLVSRAFLPTAIREYETAIEARVRSSLDEFTLAGGGDWVASVAKPIPIAIICDMLGVPAEDRDLMIELTDHLVAGTSNAELDPGAYGNTTPLRLLPFNSPAAHALREYAVELVRSRRREPRDDLVSMLADVRVDGENLREDELANFFRLLVFAGNETTRTAIAHLGLLATQCTDTFEALYQTPERIDGAAEEVIRYASPILYFRRTASRDVTLSGTAVHRGQRVVMWYASANFDEAQFERPRRFDINRPKPRVHAGFGGGGAHICLGAWLARLEIGVLLREMAARGLRLRTVEPPDYVSSNFVNGIERLSLEVV